MKLKLEQQQRERRRAMEERGEVHSPRWFQRERLATGATADSEENWEFTGKYWEIRENPEGFKMLDLDRLW